MKYKSLYAIAAILILGGCVDQYNVIEIGKTYSLNAIIENELTKTSVADDGTFSWSNGDEVWLYTASGNNVGVVAYNKTSKTATITCEGEISDFKGYAIYPYNENHKVGDIALPSSYNLGSNTSNTNAIMYGRLIDGNLKFQHIAGIVRFKFVDVPAGVNKFSLTLDKKINGVFDISMSNPIINTEETTNVQERTVVMNFDPIESNAEICLYVPIPVGEYNGLYFTLSDSKGVVYRYSNTVSNVVEQKQLLLMPEVSLKSPAAPQNFIDLSSGGTANSYIVSKPGNYCFRLVKGNSRNKVDDASKVEVLWESRNYGTVNVGDFISQVNLIDEYVTFKTPENFKEGNALIAVKNAQDEVLWSWHIWFTDVPQEQVYYRNAGIMMDRNLGAVDLYDWEALGLMYQWGRKDPFLPSTKFKKDNAEVVPSTGTWSNAKSDSTTGTIEYATKNPTTFITNDYGDWLYGEDLGVNDKRWAENKTIYDPCPPGWRVPDCNIWITALNISNLITKPNPTYSFDINVYNDMYTPGASIKFCDGGSWYPSQGYKKTAKFVLYGGYSGDYWACSSEQSYMANNLSFLYNYSTGSLKGAMWRANGYAIRCAKE